MNDDYDPIEGLTTKRQHKIAKNEAGPKKKRRRAALLLEKLLDVVEDSDEDSSSEESSIEDSDSEKSSSDTEVLTQMSDRDIRRSKRIAAMRDIDCLPNSLKTSDIDEEEEDNMDIVEYFEDDTSELRETVVKNILNMLTKDQREGLKSRIENGVNKAFEQFKELVNETMGSLVGASPTENLWKLGMGPNEIKKYANLITELRNETRTQKKITIQRILDAQTDREHKRKMLALFDLLQAMDPHSIDYLTLTSQINTLIEAANNNNLTAEQLNAMTKKEQDLKKLIGQEMPLKMRILTADIDDHRKAAIYEKYLLLEQTTDDSVTAANLQEWIEEALKTPYRKLQPNLFNPENSGEALVKLKAEFQEHLSEMHVVLEPLLTAFNNRIHHPEGGSLVIGLLGKPGTGKTSVGQVIAKAWGLPFQQISLGGVIDSSILDGQHPGWVGSSPGRFVKALQAMGVINGVLFLDELDKLGESAQGLQVQSSLLHSTDPIQNKHFNDHYLGSKLPLDLSKCLIICAINKTDSIEPALLNRMHIINVPDYTPKQKTQIMLKHLFPQALRNAGLTTADILLPEEVCGVIQNRVQQHIGQEGGVRGVKACLRVIVDKLNLLLRINNEQKKRLELTFDVDVSSKPVVLTTAIVDELYKPVESSGAWKSLYL